MKGYVILIVTLCLLALTSCNPTTTPTTMPEPTTTPTKRSIPTPTSTPEPTATPTPTFTLSGAVFFDYNGNGVHDEAEPPVESLEIAISHRDGDWVVQTDMNGVFDL